MDNYGHPQKQITDGLIAQYAICASNFKNSNLVSYSDALICMGILRIASDFLDATEYQRLLESTQKILTRRKNFIPENHPKNNELISKHT